MLSLKTILGCVISAGALLATALPYQANSTSPFVIHTYVTPGQDADLQRFNDLYLTSFHTGAGKRPVSSHLI